MSPALPQQGHDLTQRCCIDAGGDFHAHPVGEHDTQLCAPLCHRGLTLQLHRQETHRCSGRTSATRCIG